MRSKAHRRTLSGMNTMKNYRPSCIDHIPFVRVFHTLVRWGPVQTDRNVSYGDIPEQTLYSGHYEEVEQAPIIQPAITLSVYTSKAAEPLLGHHLHRTKRQPAPLIKGRRRRMCSTLVSYSGGLWVKPQPGYRLSWRRVLVVFLSPSWQSGK
jgi:hypothetical protein